MAARSYIPESLPPTVALALQDPTWIAPRLEAKRIDSAALPTPSVTDSATSPVDVKIFRARVEPRGDAFMKYQTCLLRVDASTERNLRRDASSVKLSSLSDLDFPLDASSGISGTEVTERAPSDNPKSGRIF